MGFYIRKAWNLGPFRINLSKGGVGLSFGLPGFRVGINRLGPYIHLGRRGVYFRMYLSGRRENVDKDE